MSRNWTPECQFGIKIAKNPGALGKKCLNPFVGPIKWGKNHRNYLFKPNYRTLEVSTIETGTLDSNPHTDYIK